MSANIKKNYRLKSYNTFGIDVKAEYFAEFHSVDELKQILCMENFKNMQKLVLGSGSNVLFTKDFRGLLLINRIKGKEIVFESDQWILIKCRSGEIWHDFVEFCVKNDYGSLENLSLIPGTVGAAPVQNIGAYGVELENVFWQLEAFELCTLNLKQFSKEECKFAYRDSIFKSKLKGKFIITSVTFRLTKNLHNYRLDYDLIRLTLKEMGMKAPSIKNISDAVIRLRRSKLPDPKEIGNAGSFFKNPEITEQEYSRLLLKYPDMPKYMTTTNGKVKLSAGWLIEKCGWKGKRVGSAGVHNRHALVLVNYGSASGVDMLKLSEMIKDSIKEKYSVELEYEVIII